MRCLILHCKRYEFKLDHPTPVADPPLAETATTRFDNVLLVLTAAERSDNLDTVERAAVEIARLIDLAGAGSVVINPFAHLANVLAPPGRAKELTAALVVRVAAAGERPTSAAPFGWYKSFLADVNGHANSQFFRQF